MILTGNAGTCLAGLFLAFAGLALVGFLGDFLAMVWLIPPAKRCQCAAARRVTVLPNSRALAS